MEFDRKQMTERLKLEILVLEGGGYRPSARAPYPQPQYFRDSVGCLNFALQQKEEPCLQCALMAFVPPEHQEEENPCMHIPLNAGGDTIASLEASGQRDKVEGLLREWLHATLARLEEK